MLNQKQLVRLLKKFSIIETNTFAYAKLVHKEICDNPNVKVISKTWLDYFKKKYPDIYPLDLKDWDKNWCTFDGCYDIEFNYVDNSKIFCNITIWEGNFNGYRACRKFSASVYLPMSFIKNLEDALEYRLDEYTESEYKKYLSKQMESFRNNLKAKILNVK